MDANYTITFDVPSDLVTISMAGFFSEADVAAFRSDLRDKLRTLTCLPNQHRTLCDVRGMKIQSQDIVALFTQVVGDPVLRSRRLAFVTGHSLARMQTRRLTDRKDVELFDDHQSAQAWLDRP